MNRPSFDIIERGSGVPLILIPGVQGRWEYSRGIVDALARRYRVITFSLRNVRVSDRRTLPGIDAFASQAESALDRLQLERAIVVGVSFGGLVALRFAATRQLRTQALVMISAPGPLWHLRPRHEFYAKLPWIFGPVFAAEAPFRLGREVRTAFPDWPARRKYLQAQLWTILTAPVSFSAMAVRARLIAQYDRSADCALVSAPTLIMQGDDSLDHVTGSGGTSEYARLISGATLVHIPQTGHLGSVTRPDHCADAVQRFLNDAIKDSHHSAA